VTLGHDERSGLNLIFMNLHRPSPDRARAGITSNPRSPFRSKRGPAADNDAKVRAPADARGLAERLGLDWAERH
jgi:hypothetical protein